MRECEAANQYFTRMEMMDMTLSKKLNGLHTQQKEDQKASLWRRGHGVGLASPNHELLSKIGTTLERAHEGHPA